MVKNHIYTFVNEDDMKAFKILVNHLNYFDITTVTSGEISEVPIPSESGTICEHLDENLTKILCRYVHSIEEDIKKRVLEPVEGSHATHYMHIKSIELK